MPTTCLYCGSDAVSLALDIAALGGPSPDGSPFCCEAVPHWTVSVSPSGEYAVCPCCNGTGRHDLDPDPLPACHGSARQITCDEEQGDDRRCRHRGDHAPVALSCGLCRGEEIAPANNIPAEWLGG